MKKIEEELDYGDYKIVYSKIITNDNMYYTIDYHTKEEILERKKAVEKETTESISEADIIDNFIREDVCRIITAPGDLIYLPYETKLLNKKEIKETVTTFKY